MAWAVPNNSKGKVDAAGRALADGSVSGSDEEEALEILNNWRAAHSFPLNTFQATLRKMARKVYPHALVAQRLKRTPSVVLKLRRFPKMQLSRMQDIGGCRAVVRTAAQARALHAAYMSSDLKHDLVNVKDYIADPKSSGYRGIHLVYRYRSDRSETYNGLLIEMQLRSQIQHAWATAVETVGTFLQHSLKSSEGPEPWLEFFAVTSSAFAVVEKTPLVPATPTVPKDLRAVVRAQARDLDVRRKLLTYSQVLRTLDEEHLGNARYFLLDLRPSIGRLTVTGYPTGALDRATTEYLRVEKEVQELPGAEAVLVAADSVDALRRAYPNYFLDTEVFLEQLSKVTGHRERRVGGG